MPINGNLDENLLTKINKNVKASPKSLPSSEHYLSKELIGGIVMTLWDRFTGRF